MSLRNIRNGFRPTVSLQPVTPANRATLTLRPTAASRRDQGLLDEDDHAYTQPLLEQGAPFYTALDFESGRES